MLSLRTLCARSQQLVPSLAVSTSQYGHFSLQHKTNVRSRTSGSRTSCLILQKKNILFLHSSSKQRISLTDLNHYVLPLDFKRCITLSSNNSSALYNDSDKDAKLKQTTLGDQTLVQEFRKAVTPYARLMRLDRPIGEFVCR